MSIAKLKFQKGTYLAFVLSDKCRADLLKICPPSFSKTICHHVTIVFGISSEKLKKFQTVYADSDPVIAATGLRIGTDVECFTVTVDGSNRRSFGDGRAYHVTLSVEPPAKPVDANKMLLQNDSTKIEFPEPIKLEGTFELLK